MSANPSQIRTVDPFASYNSNVVNRLTRMITKGKNALFGIHGIEVELDLSSPLDTVLVKTGQCFKDDVIVEVTANYSVLMSDASFYPFLPSWSEAGYYYIVLDYTYVKSKPAPEMSIKIFKPSDRGALSSAYLLLKVVKVKFNGITFEIESLHDYDPENPANRRIYVDLYCGVEDTLPTFSQSTDEARLIYVRDVEDLYFGTGSNWESLGAVRDSLDTSIFAIGELCYFGTDSQLHKAISTDTTSFAECIVTSVGTVGKVKLFGRCNGVKVETGVTVNPGETLFLSSTEAGTVTNSSPGLVIGDNSVGKCLGMDSPNTCRMWFIPSSGSTTIFDWLVPMVLAHESQLAISAKVVHTEITSWTASGALYYADVDISIINNTNWVNVTCWDRATYMQITPYAVESLDPTVIRIWMPTNTMIIGVVATG